MTLESRRAARLKDPGAELLDRFENVWQRHGKIALGVVGGIAVAAILGFFGLRARAATEGQASGKLAEASALFWQGQYDRSTEIAKQVIQQFGSTKSGADAHRLVADNAFWIGDYKTAITEYRSYLSRNRSGLLADAARRSLAYTLESDQQYAEAARGYEELLGRFDRQTSAEMLMSSARCYAALGQDAEAERRLERVLNEYADTPYGTQARVRLAELRASRL